MAPIPPSALSAILSIVANPALLTTPNPSQSVSISAANINNLQVLSGSFTPANNTLNIASGLALVSPNFIALICDGVVNLTSDNGMFVKIPIIKAFFAALTPVVGGGNVINTLTLDGTAANPYPMVQAKAVDYTLILGQATLS